MPYKIAGSRIEIPRAPAAEDLRRVSKQLYAKFIRQMWLRERSRSTAHPSFSEEKCRKQAWRSWRLLTRRTL
jgi:hypothetical protein